MTIKPAYIFAAALMGAAPLAYADDDVSMDEATKLIENGTIKSYEELNKAVLALHAGATIDDTELELENGRYVYQVELRMGTTPAEEWDVELDAATAEVLSDRRDD